MALKNDNFIVHLLLAAAISFGISLAAWIFWGVFELVPFWLVSVADALIAAIAGWFAGKRLAITAIAALLLRIAILALALSR